MLHTDIKKVQGMVQLLDPTKVRSVRQAVDLLNRGGIFCAQGFCIVYSEQHSANFLVFRGDLRYVALQAVGLLENPQEALQALEEGRRLAGEDFKSCDYQKGACLAEEEVREAPRDWCSENNVPLGRNSQDFMTEDNVLKFMVVPSIEFAVAQLNIGVAREKEFCVIYAALDEVFYLLYRPGRLQLAMESLAAIPSCQSK
jgi:hypothetical protein